MCLSANRRKLQKIRADSEKQSLACAFPRQPAGRGLLIEWGAGVHSRRGKNPIQMNDAALGAG
jgi:hypothetical protein